MQENGQGTSAGPGGGERSEAEPGPAAQRRQAARSGNWQRHPYTPEERRAAVEAYLQGDATQDEVCQVFGVSLESLRTWLRVYRRSGPKGLEGSITGRGLKRGRKPLAQEVAEQIVAAKRAYPDFGLRRVRDYLARFVGVKVSAGGVRSALLRAGIERMPLWPRRRGRRREILRRFERARPGELWQSDITSYVLARQSRRVYLIVFLDDFSRYVVSWVLDVHQRQEIATASLLDGIARFGKPKEVLTDQGRQYFAWRGKSDFQKLLLREGIEHVVSRAHHPETLGKCERLWETVGKELWDRVHPADLDEARERLSHYFHHYNHFRPHQGIGGLVPADRFFGAETEVRLAMERSMDENALRIALGERLRQPVYLVGRVGDEVVSVHGERGKVVVSVNGQRNEMGLEELGMEVRDDRDDDGGDDGTPADETDDAPAAAGQGVEVGASGAADQGDLGPGVSGGAGEGEGARDGAPGILARPAEQGRAGAAALRPADPGLADEPTSDGGDGGGDAEAAEREARADAEPRSGGEGAEEAGGCARARERAPDAAGEAPPDDAGQRAPRAPEGGEPCREAAEESGGGTSRYAAGCGNSSGNVDAAASPPSRGCST